MRSPSFAAWLLVASCASPPRSAEPAPVVAGTTHVMMAPAPALTVAEQQTRLEEAYAAWRDKRDPALFHALIAAAPTTEPGLPDEPWIHVLLRPDGARAALELRHGVLYVDARTGEPLAWIAGVRLHPEGFVDDLLRVGEALIDPESGRVLLAAPWFTARAGRAYVVRTEDERRCVAEERDLATERVIRTLEPIARTSDEQPLCEDEPRLTVDGARLVIPAGQWHLRSGRFQRFPGDLANAVSADGRHLAFFGPRDRGEHANFVTLVDLQTGRRTRPRVPIGWLSNATPLSFLASPARLVVTDYGIYHFELPSGRLVPPIGDPEYPDGRITRDLTRRPRPRSAAEQAVIARVAERVRHAGALVFPRAACDR